MANSGEEPGLSLRLTELLGLDQDARFALIADVSKRGFEPGCWLRVDDVDLVADVTQVRDLMGQLAVMDPVERTLDGEEEFDGEHPWDPPADGEDAWTIISQSCDLVRDIRDEPLVQLAQLRCADGGADLASWSRNSNRLLPLDPTGKDSSYYVDLRVQAFLPKQLLPGLDVRQAVPADADFAKQRPRTRFCRRVGERYSRMGIPTPIVEAVSRPIRQAAAKKAGLRKKLDEAFSEWLLMPEPEGGAMALFAITPRGSDTEEFFDAEDLFSNEFLSALPDEVLEHLDIEACTVVALDDLRVPQWMAGWKLDLDFLTYGSKGDADSPEPP